MMPQGIAGSNGGGCGVRCYDAVLFDAGETLLAPRESFGAVYARVLARHGLRLPPERLEAALRETWEALQARIPAGRNRYAYFAGGEAGYWLAFVRGTLLRALGPEATARAAELLEPLREAFGEREAWRVFDEVPVVLAALADAGVRLAVVSNWDSRLAALLERLGLAWAFDAIVVSSGEDVEKPAPAIFRRALARLGVPPERALHVGDSPELDLAGAHAAGIAALLVDRRGRLDPRWRALPDLRPLPAIVAHGGGHPPPRRG